MTRQPHDGETPSGASMIDDEERRLVETLQRIERLIASTDFDGERAAATAASGRVKAKLDALRAEEHEVEFQISVDNQWSRSLFAALLRKRGIEPYRYKRQRRTTVMVRTTKRIMDEEIWPTFQELNQTLLEYLSSTASRIINQAIGDSSEVVMREAPARLPGENGP